MKSIWENSLWFRMFMLIVWLSFIGILNFMVFAPFLWYTYDMNLIFITIFLWLVLFYVIKYFKYSYEIKQDSLYIKAPHKKKVYDIPFSEIKEIKKIFNIPFAYKFWVKFNPNKNTLYLNWFSWRWILIGLKTHDIVISPIKYDAFYERLKKQI